MDDTTAPALAASNRDRVALPAPGRGNGADVVRLVAAVAGRDLAEDAARDARLRATRALPRRR